MKIISNKISQILFALAGTIFILWKLLMPGYVLTLDAVFGPNWIISPDASNILGRLPIFYVLAFLTKVFGGWQTEKLFLFILFFLLFYLPLRYFRRIFLIHTKVPVEYIVSLFFAINPFVYERFIAGQWFVILGYALFMPLTAFLVEFFKNSDNATALKILAVMSIIAAIVPHLFVIAMLCLGVLIGIKFIHFRLNKDFLRDSLVLIFGIAVVNLYWLIPIIFPDNSGIGVFTAAHWEAFRTAGTGFFGALGNVLILHGFWQEHEYWKWGVFAIPKDNGLIFIGSMALALMLILFGLSHGLRERASRSKTFILLIFLLLAIIFSCGVGDGIFKHFNLWIFEHVSFWKGFRDSQKWSAVVTLIYVLFMGLGVSRLVNMISNKLVTSFLFIVFGIVPLLITPMLLFGAQGKLKNVDYPGSWYAANDILKQIPDCKAVFLPWHQYYILKFNNNLLTYNVARNFFNCQVIVAENAELGSIINETGISEEYDQIDPLIRDNQMPPEKVVDVLIQKGFRYVILTDDLIKRDPFHYPFLNDQRVLPFFESDGLKLYKIDSGR